MREFQWYIPYSIFWYFFGNTRTRTTEMSRKHGKPENLNRTSPHVVLIGSLLETYDSNMMLLRRHDKLGGLNGMSPTAVHSVLVTNF